MKAKTRGQIAVQALRELTSRSSGNPSRSTAANIRNQRVRQVEWNQLDPQTQLEIEAKNQPNSAFQGGIDKLGNDYAPQNVERGAALLGRPVNDSDYPELPNALEQLMRLRLQAELRKQGDDYLSPYKQQFGGLTITPPQYLRGNPNPRYTNPSETYNPYLQGRGFKLGPQ